MGGASGLLLVVVVVVERYWWWWRCRSGGGYCGDILCKGSSCKSQRIAIVKCMMCGEGGQESGCACSGFGVVGWSASSGREKNHPKIL